jgi:hypothetical protein
LAIRITELSSSIIVLMEDHRNGLSAESGNIVSMAWLTRAVANRADRLSPSGSSVGGNGAETASAIPNRQSYPQAEGEGKLQAAKLPSCQAAKLPSCKLPSCQAAKLPSCQAAKLPSCQAAKLPSCQAAKLPSCQAAKLPSCQAAKLPSCQAASCQAAKLPSCQAAKLPSCQAAKLPSCQAAKLPSCQAAKLPSCTPVAPCGAVKKRPNRCNRLIYRIKYQIYLNSKKLIRISNELSKLDQ